VNREVEYMKHLMEIEGMLHILLASAATVGRRGSVINQGPNTTNMVPSEAATAKLNVVYNVS
jgi:hypothetical protein